MFISKKSLSRRTMLRGMGATLALPFLDAMVPAATALAKTAAQLAPRFGAVFVPMGPGPATGLRPRRARAEFSPILKPIERFRDSLVVVNLDRPPGGTHAVSTSTWLTGAAPKRTEAEDFYAGISLDQVAAGPSARHGVPVDRDRDEDQAGYIGACDVATAARTGTISWKGPTTPLPMEINPRGLRADVRPPGNAEDRWRGCADQSILDSVRQDVASLQRGPGPVIGRLNEYLTTCARSRRAFNGPSVRRPLKSRSPDADRRAGVVRGARGRCSS
jgi:hypothetical protein